MKIPYIIAVVALAVAPLGGQTLDDSSLTGTYYFVHLLSESGDPLSTTNLGGSIVFDGVGGYTFDGQKGEGNDAAAPTMGSGDYSVRPDAFVTLTNPIRNDLEIDARLGDGALVVLGSSTEAPDSTYDIFVAVKAPSDAVDNSTLQGAYTGASLAFPSGDTAALNSVIVTMEADGLGGFGDAPVIGHAVNERDFTVTQRSLGATYNLNADGTGTASFGSNASLFSGDREIFTSEDGAFLLGFSTSAGGRDIFLAIKNFSTSAANRDWEGSYWIAELIVDNDFDSYSAASGALRADGAGNAALAERVKTDGSTFDFSGANAYALNTDSTGGLGFVLDSRTVNMAIGAPTASDDTVVPQAFVGAQVSAPGFLSRVYGIFFGVRMPSLSGPGVFVSPLGVVNAASFAPPTYPIAPGTLVSLFGTELAPDSMQASAIPLPTTLGPVSVTVNGILAPLFFVSAGQVNLQIPFAVAGSTATIVVTNGGLPSNEVTVPLAPSSPGIFSVSQSGAGPGVITHADFRLVTAVNPALPGETVIIFLTGLGHLNPPVDDGDLPSVLSQAIDPSVQVFFGGEAGQVLFAGAAPCCVALYQINVTIPFIVFTGPAIPVAISTSTGWTDFVDVAITF